MPFELNTACMPRPDFLPPINGPFGVRDVSGAGVQSLGYFAMVHYMHNDLSLGPANVSLLGGMQGGSVGLDEGLRHFLFPAEMPRDYEQRNPGRGPSLVRNHAPSRTAVGL